MSEGICTHPVDELERWADVPDCPGYRVSTLGNMESKRHRNGLPSPHWRRMSPATDGHGYPQVRLKHTDGRAKWYGVHQLVMLAFVGPCPPGAVVRHTLNNDPADCRLINLCYGTPADNCRDKEAHGTAQRGENHPLAVLKDEQVSEIRKRVRKVMLAEARRLARDMGLPHAAVRNVVDRKTWRHLA